MILSGLCGIGKTSSLNYLAHHADKQQCYAACRIWSANHSLSHCRALRPELSTVSCA